MSYFIQRIKSYLATPAQTQEKISDLLIELRHRGLNFDISLQEEDGQNFFMPNPWAIRAATFPPPAARWRN